MAIRHSFNLIPKLLANIRINFVTIREFSEINDVLPDIMILVVSLTLEYQTVGSYLLRLNR